MWRYILKEHLFPFLFAMGIIILVFLLNLVFSELGRFLNKGLEFRLIAEFIWLNMASIIAMAAPMAVLVATIMAFGRLSGDNEVTAMKAGGVSMLYTIVPVLIAAAFLTWGLVWFNNNILPEYNHKSRMLAMKIAGQRPTLNLEAGVVMKNIPDLSILVQKITEKADTAFVEAITIEDNRSGDKNKYIFAERGKIYSSPQTGSIYLHLYNGEMHELNLNKMEQYTRLAFPQQKISIALPDLYQNQGDSDYRGDREKSARKLRNEIKTNNLLIKERQSRLSSLVNQYFNTCYPGDVITLENNENSRLGQPLLMQSRSKTERARFLAQLRKENLRLQQQITAEMTVLHQYHKANNNLAVEVHKKYSLPFACIVFVLIGAPLGVMTRRGGMALAGGISFGFFLLYWATLIAGEQLADSGLFSPFWAMWLANILVGTAGIIIIIISLRGAKIKLKIQFILGRYILSEHFGPFVFAMSVITLVFLLNLVFRELGRILSKGLEFGLVVEFFFLNLAWIVALAVPMAVLVATIMAFGRLSGDNEITAMKAGGVSVIHMIQPVFIASIVLAIGLIWFNNNILPDFNHRTRLLASDIARTRPTLNLEAGVVMKDIPDINILVQRITEKSDTAWVEGVMIEDNRVQNKSKYIFAQKGQIYSNPATGSLILMLYDGEMHDLDLEKMEQYTRLTFPEQKLSIQVPNMAIERSDSEYRGDREKSSAMMLTEVKENDALIFERGQRMEQIINAWFDKYLPGGMPIDSLKNPDAQPGNYKRTTTLYARQRFLSRLRQENLRLKQQITAEMTVLDNYEQANYKLMVEVHKKYSIPFACIVFVLIGAPLGIMSRKGNLALAGGISFGFFLLFWASLIAGEELADNRMISPFIAMWLADIIVGAGGIYLVIHSIHESTFINWESLQTFFQKIFHRNNKDKVSI